MDKLFENVKLFFKTAKCKVDSFIFRLHYRFTLVVLVAFSIAVTGRQYIGDPIDCISRDDIPNDLLDTYCWVTTTFSVEHAWHKEIGKEIPYPGVDKHIEGEKKVYHAYYQWVCFVLFLQALLFYVPRYIWKNVEAKKIENLVMEFNNPVVSAEIIKTDEEKRNEVKRDKKKRDEEKRDKKKKDEKKSEDDESDEDKKCEKEKDKKKGDEELTNRDKAVILINYLKASRGTHNFYGFMYYATQLMNFLNVLGQIFLMDRFLGGEFTTYGTKVLSFTEWDYTLRYDPMIRVFPRMTKCTFYRYGSSGDVQKHDAMCLIPINILNEKIYIFLWFWFIILTVATGVEMLINGVTLLLQSARYYYLKINSCADLNDLEIVNTCVGTFDFVVLRLLCMNMCSCNFKIVIRDLAKELRLEYDNKMKERNFPNYEGNVNGQQGYDDNTLVAERKKLVDI